MLKRYRALPARQRADLWSALWRLVVVRILLSFGVERTRRRLTDENRPSQATLTPAEQLRWQERALALKRVGQRLPGVHCLARSLALRWWMRGCGLDARLIMGARKENDVLDSHAWIEMNAEPIDERAEVTGRYRVIWREPAADAALPGSDHERNG